MCLACPPHSDTFSPPLLLYFQSMCHMPKLHQIRHCTSLGHTPAKCGVHQMNSYEDICRMDRQEAKISCFIVRFLQEADVQMDSPDVCAEAPYLLHWLVTGSFTQHVWTIRVEQLRRHRDSSRSLSQASTFLHFQLHSCRGTGLWRTNTTKIKNKWKIKWVNE